MRRSTFLFTSRGSTMLVQGSGSGEKTLRLLARHGDFLELPFSEGRCCVSRGAEFKGTQTQPRPPGINISWARQEVSFLEDLEGAQPCLRLDFRLPASTSVKG